MVGGRDSVPVGLLIGPASILRAPVPLPAPAVAVGSSSSLQVENTSEILRGTRSLSAGGPTRDATRTAAPAPRQRRDSRNNTEVRRQRRALSSAPALAIGSSSQAQNTLLGSSFSSMSVSSSSASLSQEMEGDASNRNFPGRRPGSDSTRSSNNTGRNPRGRRHRQRPLSENTQRRVRSMSSSVQGAPTVVVDATMAISSEGKIGRDGIENRRVEAAARLLLPARIQEPGDEPPAVQTPWGARSSTSRSKRPGSSTTGSRRRQPRPHGNLRHGATLSQHQTELAVASQGIHNMNDIAICRVKRAGGGSVQRAARQNSKAGKPRLRKGRLHKGVSMQGLMPVPSGGRRVSSSPPPPVPLAGESSNRNDLSVTVLGLGAC